MDTLAQSVAWMTGCLVNWDRSRLGRGVAASREDANMTRACLMDLGDLGWLGCGARS